MRHRFSTRLPASLFTLLVLALPQHAAASGDMRPAFLAFVSRTCIHQDAAYRGSAFGKRLEAAPDFVGWDKFSATPVARCVMSTLAAEAHSVAGTQRFSRRQRAQLNDWFDANLDEAKKLAPAFRFVNSQEAAAGACPELQPGE